jgi:proline-specific peptidase
MAETQAQEGKAPFKISSIDEPCFTFYKIIGDLSCGAPPVIIAHGGPGAGHEYLLTFADLWQQYGLPVVFYDQIGCASSTHLPQKAGDQSFWQEQLFQDELDNLLDHLDLRDGPGFHLLGQSWGGMLGSAFAARQPRGLQRLVLASALASQELAGRGVRLLRDQMPPDMRQAFDEADKNCDYDTSAYKDALDFFFRKHVCRADPYPAPELVPALMHLGEDTTVYHTMYVGLLSFLLPVVMDFCERFLRIYI